MLKLHQVSNMTNHNTLNILLTW